MLRYGPESLLKKARTRVDFKHPNIVQVLNYLERKETTYLVMEYGVGEDLNRYFSPPYPTESKLLAVLIPAFNQELVLGREDFKDKIERMTKRQARSGKPGSPGVQESGVVYNVF